MRKLVMFFVLLLAALGIYLFMLTRQGFSARAKPSAMESFLANTMLRLSIPAGAKQAKNPVANTPEVLHDAMIHFADHCAMCHANNGSGDTEMGRNLYPKPPDLREESQELTEGEIYYIIHNGVRLTGMPAFGPAEGEDRQSWELVHFIRHLPQLTPAEEAEMRRYNPKSPAAEEEEQREQQFLQGGSAKPAGEHDHPKAQDQQR